VSSGGTARAADGAAATDAADAAGASDTPAREAVAAAVAGLEPFDGLEREHRAAVLDWIASGAPLYRTVPPDVPPMHLVSYFVPFDARRGELLVAAHRKSGLALPPGGHCEPGETLWETARRECGEELGIPAVALPALGPHPLFVTVTQTRATAGRPHTDVSLWFVLDVPAHDPRLRPDPREFAGVRWLSLEQTLAEDVEGFDPHMHRFTRKLQALPS
jgi:8-oxo-dGTP pyrophosphatase MutT (NUDIX family)